MILRPVTSEGFSTMLCLSEPFSFQKASPHVRLLRGNWWIGLWILWTHSRFLYFVFMDCRKTSNHCVEANEVQINLRPTPTNILLIYQTITLFFYLHLGVQRWFSPSYSWIRLVCRVLCFCSELQDVKVLLYLSFVFIILQFTLTLKLFMFTYRVNKAKMFRILKL